ncbi:MAG: Sigma-54 dependent transcriptional regulator (Modular protein) [Bryobacterales bacterium]|nr:Sigma-54 dependent transcriptional regulator (Modular protein) [Bryobacterales bacterium]
MTTLVAAERLGEPSAKQSLGARYESLIRVAEAIRSHLDQSDLFQFLADELRRVVPFDAIAQFDHAGNRTHWRFAEDYDSRMCRMVSDIPKEETAAWWVHRTQQALVVQVTDKETPFRGTIDVLKTCGLRSLCALPLSTAHRQLGSLVFASKIADAYSPEEIQFLSLVAGQIALAMDDALNFHESQQAQERLKLLLDLTNRVVSKLDLQELLREVSASIRRVMQCDSVGVTFPDPETGQLFLRALDFPGSKSEIREHIPITKDTSADLACLETVFRTGQAVNATKAEIPLNCMAIPEGTNSLCHLPLMGRDHVLGVLSLSSTRENAFSERDIVFLGQLANQIALAVENALAYGEIADLKDKLAQEVVYLQDEIRTELKFEEIVGHSDVLTRVLGQIDVVAPTDSTVLIYGETGTGKELIARAIHNLSSRQANAFVKLNCAAIPTGLLESELFGHERGAFTGAIAQRVGRFELADRGTVFLDEIGDIPLELQPKLLRVLQEREFERLGSTRTLRTDARLIAATNRDLAEMVKEQKFRSDLYYRLNVFPVRVPPLRERREDIPLLVRHFVQQFSRQMDRRVETIPSEAMNTLVRYDWPGNIRELQNVIERAVIVSRGPVLRVPLDQLKTAAPTAEGSNGGSLSEDAGKMRAILEDVERQQILAALRQTDWLVAGPKGAAAMLGMKRSTLQGHMKRLGIRVSRTGNSGPFSMPQWQR